MTEPTEKDRNEYSLDRVERVALAIADCPDFASQGCFLTANEWWLVRDEMRAIAEAAIAAADDHFTSPREREALAAEIEAQCDTLVYHEEAGEWLNANKDRILASLGAGSKVAKIMGEVGDANRRAFARIRELEAENSRISRNLEAAEMENRALKVERMAKN